MRTLAEFSLSPRAGGPIKATLMHWNQKFVVRLERGWLEQTYKFDALDFDSHESLRSQLDADAIARIFDSMDTVARATFEGPP